MGEMRHVAILRRLNLTISREGEIKATRPDVRYKLKSKVTNWFKNAKGAAAKVVHSRSS